MTVLLLKQNYSNSFLFLIYFCFTFILRLQKRLLFDFSMRRERQKRFETSKEAAVFNHWLTHYSCNLMMWKSVTRLQRIRKVIKWHPTQQTND